jgi:aldehyde:ferredoxin oxidoreductase
MTTSYCGKILRVNLTTKTATPEKLDLDLAKKYIGGRGLGTKLYMDEVSPKVDALSPENKVVIINGPLTGTNVPTGGRYMVVTKSPLTGMIACSNSGGTWGAKLKYAGYDAVILEGKADKPVYLYINDDGVEFKDATGLWGKMTEDLEHELKKDYPKANVLSIGVGGETLGLMAAVMNDKDRAAGRSGVGAVVGSKNLKAIVVESKRTVIEPTDAGMLRDAVAVAMGKIKANGLTGAALPALGTAVLVNVINSVGSFPTKNWQESYFDTADKTSGETLKETSLIKNTYCHRCPIGCGRYIKLANGQEVGGPEYETLWAYGGNCGVDDLEAINEANYWCNEYGIDTISVACTIAAAMELYQKGYIKDADCDGVPLTWGSSKAIVEWTKRIGAGTGKLGKLMAQGSYRLCDHYGVPELSMSVKKQDMPAYDPRGIQGIGITYATSNRGGCHVRGYMIAPEIAGLPEQLDRNATEGKAGWAKIFQDLTAVIDSTGMCLFTSFALGADDYAAFLNGATGTNYDVTSVLEAGERVYNLERYFNQLAGMKPEDDTLPKRLLKEAITNQQNDNVVNHLDKMLPEYYKLRGWENAFPTEATLKRLGIK